MLVEAEGRAARFNARSSLDGGCSPGERFGEQSDDDAQDVMDETDPAPNPAHRPRELDRVAAQLIGRGGQTRGLLGTRYHRFDVIELARRGATRAGY